MRTLRIKITTAYIILLFSPLSAVFGAKPVFEQLGANIEFSLPGGIKTDTLTLYLIREYSFNYLGREAISTSADEKGIFRFTIPALEAPGRIAFHLNNSKSSLMDAYYIEPGDSIFISYDLSGSGKPVFTGKGSVKFTCKLELENLQKRGVNEMQKIPDLRFMILKPGIEHIERIYRRLDYIAQRQLSLLDTYKSSMSLQMYELFNADINAYRMERKYFNTWYTASSVNDSLRNEIHQLFKSLPLPSVYQVKDSIAGQSKNYLAALIQKATAEIYFKHGKRSLTNLYQQLKGSLSGLLRDKVVTAFLLSNPTGEYGEFEMTLKDALSYVKHPSSRNLLQSQYHAFAEKAPAFPFDLPDPEGKHYKLADLQDKILVIDFWFNGCSGCILAAKDIETHVIPYFKDNEKIKFISINLDRNKDSWLKALSGGKYTVSGAVNLFTEGLAFDHPMIKFYNIQACPKLLILKNGFVFAANPNAEGRYLKELIDRAISL